MVKHHEEKKGILSGDDFHQQQLQKHQWKPQTHLSFTFDSRHKQHLADMDKFNKLLKAFNPSLEGSASLVSQEDLKKQDKTLHRWNAFTKKSYLQAI